MMPPEASSWVTYLPEIEVAVARPIDSLLAPKWP